MDEVGGVAETAEGLPEGMVHERGYWPSVSVVVGHDNPADEHSPSDSTERIVEGTCEFAESNFLFRGKGQSTSSRSQRPGTCRGRRHKPTRRPKRRSTQLGRRSEPFYCFSEKNESYKVHFWSLSLGESGEEVADVDADQVGGDADPRHGVQLVEEDHTAKKRRIIAEY